MELLGGVLAQFHRLDTATARETLSTFTATPSQLENLVQLNSSAIPLIFGAIVWLLLSCK
eukprot:2767661-Amphidinium_carterae.1